MTSTAMGCAAVSLNVADYSMRGALPVAYRSLVVTSSGVAWGAGIISTVAAADLATESTFAPTHLPTMKVIDGTALAFATTVVITTNSAIGARRRLTTADQSTLQDTTAAQLGLSSTQLRNFVFTQTSKTVSQLGQSVTTYTWTQTFTVVATPAQLGVSSSLAAYTIQTKLGPTSTSYVTSLQTNMNLKQAPVVTSSSSTYTGTVANTPTMAPHSAENKNKNVVAGISAGATAAIVICVLFVVALGVAAAVLLRAKSLNPEGTLSTCYKGTPRESQFNKAKGQTSNGKAISENQLENQLDYPASMSGGY